MKTRLMRFHRFHTSPFVQPVLSQSPLSTWEPTSSTTDLNQKSVPPGSGRLYCHSALFASETPETDTSDSGRNRRVLERLGPSEDKGRFKGKWCPLFPNTNKRSQQHSCFIHATYIVSSVVCHPRVIYFTRFYGLLFILPLISRVVKDLNFFFKIKLIVIPTKPCNEKILFLRPYGRARIEKR